VLGVPTTGEGVCEALVSGASEVATVCSTLVVAFPLVVAGVEVVAMTVLLPLSVVSPPS
jgi:hypothetical protein